MKTNTASTRLQAGVKGLLQSCSFGLIAVLGLPAATSQSKAAALTEAVKGNTAFALDLHRRERDLPEAGDRRVLAPIRPSHISFRSPKRPLPRRAVPEAAPSPTTSLAPQTEAARGRRRRSKP